MIPFVKDFIEKNSMNKRVLDLGCGDMNNGSYCILNGADSVVFVDINKCDDRILRFDLEKDIPLKDESFDVVLLVEVVEHIDRQIGLLNEVYRLLKSGGLVIITTPNILSWYSRIYFAFVGKLIQFHNKNYEDIGHINPFIPSIIVPLIEKKFKIVCQVYHNGVFPLLSFKVFSCRFTAQTLILVLRKDILRHTKVCGFQR